MRRGSLPGLHMLPGVCMWGGAPALGGGCGDRRQSLQNVGSREHRTAASREVRWQWFYHESPKVETLNPKAAPCALEDNKTW